MVQVVREGSYWFPLICLAVVLTFTGYQQVSIVLFAMGVIDARSSAVVYVWDPSTLRFTFADPEAEQQTGYTPAELYDMTVPDLTGKPADNFRAISELVIHGIVSTVETTGLIRRKNERLFRSHLARHSLMIVPGERPQILVQARAMLSDELAAPACVLSVS